MGAAPISRNPGRLREAATCGRILGNVVAVACCLLSACAGQGRSGTSAPEDPCAKYRSAPAPPDMAWPYGAEVTVRDAVTREIIPFPTFKDAHAFAINEPYHRCADSRGGTCIEWFVSGPVAVEVGAVGYQSVRIDLPYPTCGGLLTDENGCEYGCGSLSFGKRAASLSPAPPDMAQGSFDGVFDGMGDGIGNGSGDAMDD